ncbi:hypothetical protein Y032_0007g3403 [Ancylostoma ceylanicum]|uniref:Uncharacterized protein n=1 Tax=Ancylostoma ceylanicum TaxID=53326 RepID=A0A016VN58_9BILA|nr:hypothetical protein Y032_0007g3403 [Ancylostoma ceylanicum]
MKTSVRAASKFWEECVAGAEDKKEVRRREKRHSECGALSFRREGSASSSNIKTTPTSKMCSYTALIASSTIKSLQQTTSIK